MKLVATMLALLLLPAVAIFAVTFAYMLVVIPFSGPSPNTDKIAADAMHHAPYIVCSMMTWWILRRRFGWLKAARNPAPKETPNV